MAVKYAWAFCLGAGWAACGSLPAMAAESDGGRLPAQNRFIASPSSKAEVPMDQRDVVDRMTTLPEADLASYRGGETIVVGSQTLSAVANGNILNGNYTAGAVTLSNNALSNFSGIGNFAINTGAQVNLQSGMNLTINIGQ